MEFPSEKEIESYTYCYYNHRVEAGGGYDYGVTEQIKDFKGAVESLFRYELGYGGRLVEVTPTRIVVRTRVLSKVDTVTFESTEKEMVPLLVLLRAWSEAQSRLTPEDLWEGMKGFWGGREKLTALEVTLSAGLVLGNCVRDELRKSL